MKSFLLVVTMICTGLYAGIASAQPAASAAEQAIRPVMKKMLVAANAYDTDGFMAPMVRSPKLVFAINGETIQGWKALHAQQLKWWSKGKDVTKFTYAENGASGYLALGPNVEIVTWPLVSHWTTPDGKTGGSDFVVTYVWRHFPHGWRIVYGHESWQKLPG